MEIILFDPAEVQARLKPLTLTRPCARLRQGILTIEEKWQRRLPGDYSVATADSALQPVFNPAPDPSRGLWIAGNIVPDAALADAVGSLAPGEALRKGDRLIARNGSETSSREYDGELTVIDSLTDIFSGNDAAIAADFELLTAGRTSQPLDPTCRLIGDPSRLFIEEGATLLCATINTLGGPVYIGRDATVMEGVNIRGSLALCDHSQLNMGAKIYGGTTIGPHCKVGGEINNAVFTGFSNKAHDGFLGNAVIGEWCNLGAGCVSSNLKNNYLETRLWSYASERFEPTGLQFTGLIMGDHSKAGINTMFNTATSVGVGCNIYGAGFPRTFIPSFSMGGAAGMTRQPFAKFVDTARKVMARRHCELAPAMEAFLRTLYDRD